MKTQGKSMCKCGHELGYHINGRCHKSEYDYSCDCIEFKPLKKRRKRE